MPRTHLFISCVLMLALIVPGAFADTVTLKNGEHLEGKITKETATDITMAVQVSAGITDDRVIPKASIDKIEKISPEIIAYQAIAGIRLGADSMGPTQYEPAINALEAFVKEYPNSKRTLDVQTILNSFLEEKKRVAGGEVKIDNNWLSKADYERDKVQIGARLAFAYMKTQSAAGDYIGAMNTYEAIEKNFPGAAVMPPAIELARQILPALKSSVEKAVQNQKAFKADRTKSLAAAPPAERAEMNTAIKREEVAADATADAAEKAGTFPPILMAGDKSLTTLAAHVDHEITRLAALPVDKMKQSVELSEAAKRGLDTGDATTVADKLKQATNLWNANELAQRLVKEESEKKSAPSTTPAPTSTTPVPATPTPAPVKKHITTPAPAADAGGAPAGTSNTASADDEKSFFMTIPGAATMVVGLAVVLAGGNIYLKKKRKAAEESGNII